jgi:diguanylate cyclase (GGDEF)-like protein/PAS domain S-box-containing protein
MPGELDAAQYREILKVLPNPVSVVDRDRRIVFWNRAAESFTGYARSEMTGRRCPDTPLKHCDENFVNLCENGCPLLQTIQDGKPREAKLSLQRKDGQRQAVRVRCAAVRDPSGAIVGAVETFDARQQQETPRPSAPGSPRTVRRRIDVRTGLADRDSVLGFLEACVEDFAQQPTPVSVLCVAIDEFTAFRKARGQQATSRILQALAEMLSGNLNKNDLVGYFAENRFVAVLTDCPAAGLSAIGTRLRLAAQTASISWWGDQLSVSISTGGTALRAEDSAESVIARAERALQKALDKGGSVEIA